MMELDVRNSLIYDQVISTFNRYSSHFLLFFTFFLKKRVRLLIYQRRLRQMLLPNPLRPRNKENLVFFQL